MIDCEDAPCSCGQAGGDEAGAGTDVKDGAGVVEARALATTIEWEELPSLADGLRRPDARAPMTSRPGPVWNVTMPLDLWQPRAEPMPAPFREPLNGLHVREISGTEVFEHFFGDR